MSPATLTTAPPPSLARLLTLIDHCTRQPRPQRTHDATQTSRSPSTAQPAAPGSIRPQRTSGTLELLWKLWCHENRPARRVLIEENICRLCKPLVAACARRIHLSRGVDADDLMQEGFIAVISCLRRYDPAAGVDFAAFVPKRVRGAMLDAAEKYDRQSHLRPLDDTSAEPAAADADPSWVIDLEVAHLLEPLPVEQRNIVILCIVEGLDTRTAAARLGIHASTVSRRLRMALQTMRRYNGI